MTTPGIGASGTAAPTRPRRRWQRLVVGLWAGLVWAAVGFWALEMPAAWGGKPALTVAFGLLGALLGFIVGGDPPLFSLEARDPGMRARVQVAVHRLARVVPSCDEAARKACAPLQKILDDEMERPVPTFGWYYEYDAVWEALYAMRHEICEFAPPGELLALAADIRHDLQDYADSAEGRAALSHLAEMETEIRWRLHAGGDGKLPAWVRSELRTLSILGGGVRQARWRKTNRLRARLSAMALLMSTCVVALVVLLPGASWGDKLPVGMTRNALALAACFGAAGGLLSALQSREPTTMSSAAYYVERIVLYMRPIVGALSGLVLYLMQATELLRVGPKESSQVMFFVVAFVGGFSERFWLSRLSEVEALGTGAAGKADTAAARREDKKPEPPTHAT